MSEDRSSRAERLLGPDGELGDACFPTVVRGGAYFIFLAYSHGRKGSVLKGRPKWEANDILSSRVRSCASRSGGVAEWGSLLFRTLNCRIEQLDSSDAIWWRKFCAENSSVKNWRKLKNRQSLEEALTGYALLSDWLFEKK